MPSVSQRRVWSEGDIVREKSEFLYQKKMENIADKITNHILNGSIQPPPICFLWYLGSWGPRSSTQVCFLVFALCFVRIYIFSPPRMETLFLLWENTAHSECVILKDASCFSRASPWLLPSIRISASGSGNEFPWPRHWNLSIRQSMGFMPYQGILRRF